MIKQKRIEGRTNRRNRKKQEFASSLSKKVDAVKTIKKRLLAG